MNRRHQENAFFGFFIPAHLQHHGNGFHHKQAAHNHQHKFLANNHGNRAQRRAQCQRAYVAHKHLRGVGVEPQKAQTRAAHGGAENGDFVCARHKRQLQVFGKFVMPCYISKNAQAARHQHHGERSQPVQAIG